MSLFLNNLIKFTIRLSLFKVIILIYLLRTVPTKYNRFCPRLGPCGKKTVDRCKDYTIRIHKDSIFVQKDEKDKCRLME